MCTEVAEASAGIPLRNALAKLLSKGLTASMLLA